MIATRLRGPRSEGAIQREIVEYLRAVLRPEDAIIYANANASRRTPLGRAANAIPGLLPGIPDLSVVTRGGSILFIEVKGPTGKLSEPQEEIIYRFVKMSVPYVVARSIDDVKAALAQHRIPTREAA